MEKRCVQELNQLLKGTHMGASLFEDLKTKVEDPKLIKLIDDCLKRLRKHMELLAHHVREMDEEPAEDGGFFQGISEIAAMVKTMPIVEDEELAKECVRYMEMAIKALNAFEQKQYILEPMVQRSLYYMRDDYMIIYHTLPSVRFIEYEIIRILFFTGEMGILFFLQ